MDADLAALPGYFYAILQNMQEKGPYYAHSVMYSR